MKVEQLKSADAKLTAVRAGTGRDVVIVHSLLTDRHAFDLVLPDLTSRFKVTLPNLPGFHGTPPVGATIGAYADWLRRTFDEFEIGKDAILIGNGFGGTVALAFAIANSDRISKLLLADVAPGFPEAGKEAFRIMAARVAENGMGAIAEIAANRVFHAAYLEKHTNAVNERRTVLMNIGPAAFRAACSALVDTDLVPALATLKVPTLIIYGELDQATPPVLNKLIASKVPGAGVIELPACGHCPPLEQPNAFLTAIGPFLNG